MIEHYSSRAFRQFRPAVNFTISISRIEFTEIIDSELLREFRFTVPDAIAEAKIQYDILSHMLIRDIIGEVFDCRYEECLLQLDETTEEVLIGMLAAEMSYIIDDPDIFDEYQERATKLAYRLRRKLKQHFDISSLVRDVCGYYPTKYEFIDYQVKRYTIELTCLGDRRILSYHDFEYYDRAKEYISVIHQKRGRHIRSKIKTIHEIRENDGESGYSLSEDEDVQSDRFLLTDLLCPGTS